MTYNPAATISGHVAVHLQLLAKLTMEEDGVDSTESISICQMLGTVLRMWEHSAPYMGKKETSRNDPASSLDGRTSCINQ